MSAPRTPLPQVGYQRDHEGSWTLYRDGMRIGRIDRDLETQALSVMVDNLYWSLDGTKLQTHGGLAVRPMHKRRQLKIICLEVAYALRDFEAAGHVEPATIAPRVKPKITIDLEPQPRAVKVTPMEDRSAMVTVEGLCSLPLSESEARALWVGLGNHLCEPAGPGLDRRAAPPIRDEAQRMKGARITIDRMLRTTFHSQYRQEATEDDLVLLRRAIGELGQ